jgi:hypothetical protein
METQEQYVIEKRKITQSDINYFFMVFANSLEMSKDSNFENTKELDYNYNAVREQIAETLITDPYQYTKEELLMIGFRQIKAESDILLVPIWFYDLLPKGTLLTHKESELEFYKGDVVLPDTTVEFGLTAYGVKIK